MEKRKFLVVIDPSHERHLALERMLDIVRQRSESPLEFHLLIGFESDDRTDPNAPPEVVRSMEWFNLLLNPLEELGVATDSNLRVTHHAPPPQRAKGIMVEDVTQLVQELKNRGLI